MQTKRMKTFKFRLSEDENRRLRALAERYNINVSTLIRHAINAYVRTGRPFDDSADLIAVDSLSWNYLVLRLDEACQEQERKRDEVEGIAERAHAIMDGAEENGVDDFMARELWQAVETTRYLELQMLDPFEEMRDRLLSIDTSRLLELSRLGRVTIDGAEPDDPDVDAFEDEGE